MATVTTTPTTSDVVRFEPNQPQELATRYPEGRRVAGMNGDRIMYSLADGRKMFLDPAVAELVDSLMLAPGESFFLAKQSAGRSPGGRTQYRWNAWLSPATEKARAAAAAPAIERDLRESARIAEEAKAAGLAPAAALAEAREAARPAAPNPIAQPAAWAQTLLTQTQILTDVYAKAISYGLEAHQGRVKPEEIRNLLVTAFIQLAKK